MGHPTQQKERLMNKILSQMMINCREHVTPDQVDTLQSFKDAAADFDWTQSDYAPLLNFDLGRYQVDPSLPQEKQEGPVDMSQAETMMQTIVEDLSEEMKREKEEEMRSNRGGGPQIAFMDLSNMSGFTALLYVASIIGLFGIVFYVLINKIIAKPVDFTKQKKLERQAKAGSKQKS
jgi:hypothetical protein